MLCYIENDNMIFFLLLLVTVVGSLRKYFLTGVFVEEKLTFVFDVWDHICQRYRTFPQLWSCTADFLCTGFCSPPGVTESATHSKEKSGLKKANYRHNICKQTRLLINYIKWIFYGKKQNK